MKIIEVLVRGHYHALGNINVLGWAVEGKIIEVPDHSHHKDTSVRNDSSFLVCHQIQWALQRDGLSDSNKNDYTSKHRSSPKYTHLGNVNSNN